MVGETLCFASCLVGGTIDGAEGLGKKLMFEQEAYPHLIELWMLWAIQEALVSVGAPAILPHDVHDPRDEIVAGT